MDEYEIGFDDPQDRFNCKPVKFIEHDIELSSSKKEEINGLEKQINRYRKSIGLKPIENLKIREIKDEDIPF